MYNKNFIEITFKEETYGKMLGNWQSWILDNLHLKNVKNNIHVKPFKIYIIESLHKTI